MTLTNNIQHNDIQQTLALGMMTLAIMTLIITNTGTQYDDTHHNGTCPNDTHHNKH
jgi:hypothetical protein